MSLTHRLFADAYRDMQRAMSAFEQPLLNTRILGQDIMRYPSTDMVESNEGYELHCELPGYDKKNIKIEVSDDRRTLVLSGSVRQSYHQDALEAEQQQQETGGTSTQGEQKKNETQVTKKNQDTQVAKQYKKPQWWVNERVVGSFSRSFSFPTPIEADKVKATFDNGILQINVPKSAQSQPRQINID